METLAMYEKGHFYLKESARLREIVIEYTCWGMILHCLVLNHFLSNHAVVDFRYE